MGLIGVRTAMLLIVVASGVVALYLATRRTWDWPRLLRRAGVVLTIVVAVVWGWIWWSALPPTTPGTELWGVRLGASQQDVLFLKGEPVEKVDPATWVYAADRSRTYFLGFDDTAHVNRILVEPGPGYSSGITLFGVREGFDAERLVDRVGEPSEILPSDEGLRRAYLYRHLNAVYVLQRGSVVAFGIYTGDLGDPFPPSPAGQDTSPAGQPS